MKIKIAPSILSCDFSRLADECRKMEQAGADMLHVDVMDGHFVRNITIGPAVVKALRPHVKIPLDVHLMLENPQDYAAAFIEAGADIVAFHVESKAQPAPLLERIRALGARAGLVLKPDTPPQRVLAHLPRMDAVMVMTVEPGFGGQAFLTQMTDKISFLRRQADAMGLGKLCIEVDGGINDVTARAAARAGADLLVSGSALFAQADYARAVRALRLAGEAGYSEGGWDAGGL